MKLQLNRITGFKSADNIIRIYDKDDRTLYYFENPTNEDICFNLIRGEWFTDNNLTKLSKPLVYITPPIAEPEINREVKPMNIRVGENPNKCTIDFDHPDFVDILVDHE